jgi:hypothetical protein
MEPSRGLISPRAASSSGALASARLTPPDRGRMKVRARTELAEFGQKRRRASSSSTSSPIRSIRRAWWKHRRAGADKRNDGISGLATNRPQLASARHELKKDANPQLFLTALPSTHSM